MSKTLGKLQKADGAFGHGAKVLDLLQKAKECHLKNLRNAIFISEPVVRPGKENIEKKTSAKVHGIYGIIEAMGSIAISCVKKFIVLKSEVLVVYEVFILGFLRFLL
ncbi:MAG: hypothetical protein QXL38_02565 [Candidatus Bathyarchaeia archaeon]